MRCFWSVKSPFPAASRSDAASNSFRCTNLPSCSRKRSRPFFSRQNTKNRSLRDHLSLQSEQLTDHAENLSNVPVPLLGQRLSLCIRVLVRLRTSGTRQSPVTIRPT